jgi:hypothetical protein
MIYAPIDLVDNVALRRRGQRRHGEIGVAAKIAKQSDLTIKAAPFAIWKRVVESPVAVNETKDSAAILLSKQSVVVCKSVTVLGDLSNKGFPLLIVVVEVYLDVGDAKVHHLGYTIKQVSPVLFLRIEKTVLGALSSGVPWSIISDERPPVPPLRHAPKRSSNRRAHS